MIKPADWFIPDNKHTEAIMNYMLKQRHIKKPKQLTNTIHLQCTHCNVTIHSSYSGEYVSCTCGKIGIDQTDHCTRMIGNEWDYLVVNKQKELK